MVRGVAKCAQVSGSSEHVAQRCKIEIKSVPLEILQKAASSLSDAGKPDLLAELCKHMLAQRSIHAHFATAVQRRV